MHSDSSVRRLALLIEYEGTAYGGSQYQANARTIQGWLERALSSLTSEPIRIALAGRTDAGVHARGQVASFVTASRHSPDTFVRGLNALLPLDISVRAAADVPADFDPRRRALSRRYRYTILLRPQRSALRRRFVWQVDQPLDLDSMTTAAALLVGRLDFAAFSQPSLAGRRRTDRLVTCATLRRTRDMAQFDIEANSFLPHMVRRIVGTLVQVGLRKTSLREFETLGREAPPGAAAATAPARGLCLMRVRYESGLFDDETDEDI